MSRANDHQVRGPDGHRIENGMAFTVTRIDTDAIACRDADGRQWTIPRDWAKTNCEAGYATTIHKSQGMTVDRCAAMFPSDARVPCNLQYVAATRGREENHLLYACKDEKTRQTEAMLSGSDTDPEAIARQRMLSTLLTRPDTRTATETRIDEHEERYSLTRLLREHDYAAGLIAGPHLEAKLRQCHNPGIVSMITRSPNWEWLRALWSRAWMTDPKRAMAIVSRDISPKDEHGNRQDPAAVMADAARASGLPVLFSVQGVMRDCAAHLCDGVPEKYRRSGALWHAIDKIIPGELLDNMQASFDALAAKEAAALADARYVTGRTAFDRAACAALAPHARYYPCNETLRPLFYTGALWHAREFGRAPVLFLPQGNYPLKNLHTVIRALPAVRQQFPGATLHIAGWPPLDKGPLLRPIIDRMFPYKLYCKRLAAQLGVADALHYTGPLDAAAMRQAYLEADVFLLPSSCENSPNSLGEAMLLGMPCVASNAGGIPDMLVQKACPCFDATKLQYLLDAS